MRWRLTVELRVERSPKPEPIEPEQHDTDLTSTTERADPRPLGFQPPEREDHHRAAE